MKGVIGWFSGGVTSAVACKMCIDIYGADEVRIVFIDTRNEDEDTYRFLRDCEKWYGIPIETISDDKYDGIESIWRKHLSLNTATGAICSTKLKREVREKWQKTNPYRLQAFGFDTTEAKRAIAMSMNNPKLNPVYPLMYFGKRKSDCFKILAEAGIEPPRMYRLGYHNNNCFKTGCVQGCIGYWQKIRDEAPDKFRKMALLEHELSHLKEKPVTILRDQSNEAKSSGNTLVFLLHNPEFPQVKDLSMMKGVSVEPMIDCNGYCGINDLMSAR